MSFTKITFTIIFIITQIIVTSAVAFAGAEADNSITGTVWSDDNMDNVLDLNESPKGMTIVYMQAEGDDVIEANITDENGTFIFNSLPNGKYTVWGEDMSGNSTDIQLVELSDTNGAAVVNLGMTPELSVSIFLPVVMN